MILKLIPPSRVDTSVYELPASNMDVDPRPIYDGIDFEFELTVNGTALTVTRTDREEDERSGWHFDIRFRVYCRNEFRYSFDSTKYLYHGLKHERAPLDATEIVVKDGAERIWGGAFYHCSDLSKINIPNTVNRILYSAFWKCHSIQFIQLPRNLQYIGSDAFGNCKSLEAIYLPPTLEQIGDDAFRNCKSLRIINIPDSVRYIHLNVLEGCNGLLTEEIKNAPSGEEDQFIRNRYNPLHKLCWDTSVTANSIQQYIEQHYDDEERARTKDKPQFTPLHLLAANPSVTGDMITTYLHLAPDAAMMQDNIGRTPLHMLCSALNFSGYCGGAIRAYIEQCVNGKTAAFMKDNKGMTPFDCLCKIGYDGMPFLKNQSFGGLMEWWYNCLGINLFGGTYEIPNLPIR